MNDENPAAPEADEPVVDVPSSEESAPVPEPAAEPTSVVPQPVAPPPPPPPPAAPEAPVAPPVEVLPGPVSDSDKILAILGYIFGVVALVALFIDPYKHNPFVRLNAVQAIALWVIGLTWWIPVLGWILSLVAFVVAVIAIVKAFQGEYYRIPVIYDVVKGFVEE